MNALKSKRFSGRTILIAALGLIILSPVAFTLQADEKPKVEPEKPSQLAKELHGTWALAGPPDNVVAPPKTGGRLKFFTGRHWTVTQADPESGKVTLHLGGTYTLAGDEYTETVDYAMENIADVIKQT